MYDNEDWIMRPILAGKLDFLRLFDASVTLDQIALLNEALDVEQENKLRLQKFARERDRKRG